MSDRYFFAALFLLIAIRFLHFGKQIDQPHDWRQCDTAYYIDDFYKKGVDLFYPAVCWMGASDTLALEFPLPEAIVASTWKITGRHIWIARSIFLLFFIGATYYFYKIIAFFGNEMLAKSATVIYVGSPLAFFYSRAIHIDFFVLLFTHAMVFYFLVAVKRKKFGLLVVSAIAATIGFLVKAPYVFYWCIPMMIYVVQQKALSWFLKYGWLYLTPV
ncbi:MAG: glycosyltransferase family 39 protein, partial [Saprospiraceae bacterium]|nr:glycosyltransferase family 39 protein [Saprospiraceae bacterium]